MPRGASCARPSGSRRSASDRRRRPPSTPSSAMPRGFAAGLAGWPVNAARCWCARRPSRPVPVPSFRSKAGAALSLWRVSPATTHRSTTPTFSSSSGASGCPNSTRRCAPPSRSRRSSVTVAPPIAGAATTRPNAGPRGSSRSATPSAPSTHTTAKACRSPRCRRRRWEPCWQSVVSGRGSHLEFQRRLARLIATPWLMATTEESRYPETSGAQFGWRTRLNLWYTDRLLARAAHDPRVMAAFVNVSQLIAPFSAVLRPRVLVPVLLSARGGPPTPPAVSHLGERSSIDHTDWRTSRPSAS